MEYRMLGRTGLQVGVIGLGTEHMVRSQESMEEVLHTAVDAGLNSHQRSNAGDVVPFRSFAVSQRE